MSLLPLIPIALTGAKALYTAFNKPKRQNPEQLLQPLDRIIANNNADIMNKSLLNQTTSAVKGLGARLYQQSQRGLEAMQSSGEISEGQKARGLLQASADIQEKVGEQQQGALLAQRQDNLQSRERVDQARMQIAQIKEQYRQNNQMLQSQWRNELAGGVLDTLTTGFNAAMGMIQKADVRDQISDVLEAKGVASIAELDSDGLNSLMMTLMAARYGLTMPSVSGSTETPKQGAGSGTLGGDTVIPSDNLTGDLENEYVNEALGKEQITTPAIDRDQYTPNVQKLSNPIKLTSTMLAPQKAEMTLPQIQARINQLAKENNWGKEMNELIEMRKKLRGY